MARGGWTVAMMAASALGGAAMAQSPDTIRSPDGRVTVHVALDDAGGLRYDVSYGGQRVIAPSPVGLVLATDHPENPTAGDLSTGLRIASAEVRQGRDSYAPVHGKTSRVDDGYAELVVHARETKPNGRAMDLILRAYDSGAAFRIMLPRQPGLDRVDVLGETTRFLFPADYGCLGLNLGKFHNSHEGEFDPVAASLIRAHALFDMPLVCRSAGATLAITESDLEGYSGAWLSGTGDGALGVAVTLTPRLDNDRVAVSLPMTAAGVRTPWRVVMLADRPERLIESNLVDELAAPSRIADTSWIKPGKASWDWWSGPDVPNAGHDDATYRRFIDFAARFGLPYTLIDEGWAKGAGGAGYVKPDSDLTRSAPGVDIPALATYARGKGVGLWLWANWQALDTQMDQALPLFERWGIKGIKIDFMDRQDQAMVDFYHRLLTRAADHHLMVDLHGAYVPRGLERTYPNFMTQEGVMGAEYNKWSHRVTPTHNVHLAFTRALLGPLDYTPGGFRNVTADRFQVKGVGPEVMTTRAQQLAMYVVYPSPFACLADTPLAYEDSTGKPVPGADFLKRVPTSWDETRALAGDFGRFIVIARRKGDRWYLGAMNDETPRTVTVPLAALGSGKSWQAEQWADGAQPAEVIAGKASPSGTMTLTLAAGGGYAAVLSPR